MNIKVIFIGNDDYFFDELEQRFRKDYPGFAFVFFREGFNHQTNPFKIYKKIYKYNAQIIFLDFEDDMEFAKNLAKLINSNGEFRRKALCGLHDLTGSPKSFKKALLSQVRINHIKGIELHNIIYNTLSLLDVEIPNQVPFSRGENIGMLDVYHIGRICFLTDDYYHVETNLPLEVGQVIEIDAHPLDHIANSKRFLVKNFKDSNLYYNTRYSYELDFTYIDNTYFQRTEQSWIDYNTYKNEPQRYEQETGKNYELMIREVKKRKVNIRYIRDEIRDWIKEKKNHDLDKIKVLIVDDHLESLYEIDKVQEYVIRYETSLAQDLYQIRRFCPHIIIFNKSEKNDDIKINELIEYLNRKEDKPFLIICNSKEDEFKYEKTLTFPQMLSIDIIEKLAKRFEEAFPVCFEGDRVFLSSDSKNVAIKIKEIIDIYEMTESEVFFRTNKEFPMYSVLELIEPVPMFLTIIPMTANMASEGYRAVISGLNEKTSAQLRVLINHSLVEEEEQVEQTPSQSEESEDDKDPKENQEKTIEQQNSDEQTHKESEMKIDSEQSESFSESKEEDSTTSSLEKQNEEDLQSEDQEPSQ
ncbi:MAG: hypothetical protein N4A33_05375 [Bacteriovoracaceae bacterium]|jgi:hypothetical protein|nr:hypothetical protein [Bacteriovoracaceae bacterium]